MAISSPPPTYSTGDRSVLRAFRADEFRELARMALAQGWEVYPEHGGHVAAVCPTTGRLVRLSVTAYAAHGVLEAKRREFAQAGLDLRSKAERRRAHRQEARMHVHLVQGSGVPPVTATAAHPFLDSGETRPDSRGRRRRVCACGAVQNAPQHRVQPVAAVQVPLPEPEPEPVPPPAPDPEPEPEPVPEPDAVVTVWPNGSATVEEGRLDRVQAAWHVVRAEPGEYPLAEALDHLDTALAPGLAALEAAGRQDAAELVRAELVRTPLEEELLALYRRVMTGD